jgi:hypothetical protein
MFINFCTKRKDYDRGRQLLPLFCWHDLLAASILHESLDNWRLLTIS